MKSIFQNYQYFLAIVSQGTITAAAESLYISQPSLTQYLKQLEDRLGATLFDRSCNPLRLTSAGEIFLRYSMEYQKLLDNMSEELQGRDDEIKGSLEIGIPLQLQPFFSKHLIIPFQQKYPGIKVSINGNTSLNLEKMISRGSIAVSIIHIQKQNYQDLEYIKLKDDPVLMVCNREHRLVKGREASRDHPVEVEIADVKDELFFMLEPSFILRRAPDELFHSVGVDLENVLQLSNINTAISLAVGSSDGIAFVTKALHSMIEEPQTAAFMVLKNHPIVFSFVLCFRKDDTSQITEAFVKHVRSMVSVIENIP